MATNKKQNKVAGKKAPVNEKPRDIVDGLYDYARMLERSMVTQDNFGEGLSCSRAVPSECKGKGVGAKIKVTKDGKLIGTTSSWPIYSFEQGRLFMLDSEDGKGVQFVNGKGQRYPRVFGPGSASMSNGHARVQIIDEEFDRESIQTLGKKEPKIYTFIKLSKEGKIRTMKARFSQACFIDKCGLGRVVVAGEQGIWTYVDKNGKVLPYRFSNAEECFRGGLATVRLIDGRSAFICEDGHIYKQLRNGKIVWDEEGEKTSSINNSEHFRIDEKGLVHSLKKEREKVAKENAKKRVKIEVEKPLQAENEDVEIVVKNKKQKEIVLF